MHFQEHIRCTSISGDRSKHFIFLVVISVATLCSAQVFAHESRRESSQETAVESPAADEPEAVKATAVTQPDAVARDVNRSAYDKIWQFANWYENDSNPIVQQVLFSGRYQHEYNALGADQGNNGEWNVRRMRFGPKVTLFRNWLVHGEIEVNPQETHLSPRSSVSLRGPAGELVPDILKR